MVLNVICVASDQDIQEIDKQKRASDHDRLTHFQPIDSRVDVDAIRAEDAQQHDVHVVPPIYLLTHFINLRRSIPVPYGSPLTSPTSDTSFPSQERSSGDVPRIRPTNLGHNLLASLRWENDRCRLLLRPVGLRQRKSGDTGNNQFVAPTQLDHIVYKSKECH